jgi:hypothetical protein
MKWFDDQRGLLFELRDRLYRHIQQGVVDPDVDAAYWRLDRVLDGRGFPTEESCRAAVFEAREVLMRLEPEARKAIPLPVRAITKDNHDAMMGTPGQGQTRSMSAEEYQQMIKEAQGDV